MEYPLISRELIVILRLVHGIFNFCVMLLFFYHARNGLRIRSARQGGAPLSLPAVKNHRKLGPILAAMGVAGFLAGVTLVLVDTGNLLRYPLHLLVGALIMALLAWTYLVSRKIAGPRSPLRDLHFRLGVAILTLYPVNVFIGIGVLL